MHRLSLLLAFGMFPLVGCADEHAALPSGKYMEEPVATPREAAAMNIALATAAPGGALEDPAPGADKVNAAGISRKVIYDATVDLVVKDVDEAVVRVGALVEQSGGYIAEQDMAGSPGANRSQRWKIRIPIEAFESFVASVSSLGELERFNRKSQDVTAQYYDIDARIKNKKVEEATLQKLLEERSGALEDVLKVEVELSRVRGEIEQLQGQLRVLENLSSLATLTLNVRERETFEPPAPVVADFPTQISRAWGDSLRSLTDLGKAVTLFVVSQIVWLPFWLVGLLLAWIIGRKLHAAARIPIRISVGHPSPPSVGDGGSKA